MDHFGARLKSERKRLGLTLEGFAELVSTSKPSQVRYESGERSPDSDYLQAAVRAGVDVPYLLTGERSVSLVHAWLQKSEVQRATEIMAQGAADDEFARIPLHEAFLAAGTGAENGSEEVVEYLAFRRDWLVKVGVAPAAARLARVTGDSMSPTLCAGDMVLIDTSRVSPPHQLRDPRDTRPAPIFAVLDDGAARIKRLDQGVDDNILLISDNKFHPTERRPLSSLTIIGRVMWWGHTNRE